MKSQAGADGNSESDSHAGVPASGLPVRPVFIFLVVLMVLSSPLTPLGKVSAQNPPQVLAVDESPNGNNSDNPVRVGTVITYTVVANDQAVPPASTLTFTLYWNFSTPDGPGDLNDRTVVQAPTDTSGNAFVATPHPYATIGPWQQRDLNGDGRNDTGGWFLLVKVDDGGGGPFYGAAYTFLVVPLGNRAPIITYGLPDTQNITLNPPSHKFPVNLAIAAEDPDNDSLNVTWAFGDGAFQVNHSGPALKGVQFNASHVYDANISRTPRSFSWTATATVDDGHGHKVWAGNTTVSMYVTTDYGPQLPPEGISYGPKGPRGSRDYPFVYNGVPINFSIQAKDPNSDPLTYYWDFEDDSTIDALGSSVFWIFHGGESLTPHAVRVYVTDGGWKEPTSAHTVHTNILVYARDNVRPVLPAIPAYNNTFNATLEKPLVFSYVATDRDGDNLTFQLDYGDGQSAVFAGVHNDTWEASHDIFGAYNLTFNHTYSEATCTERANYTSGVGKQVTVIRGNCVYHVTLRALDNHTAGSLTNFLVYASSSNEPPVFTTFVESQEGADVLRYYFTNATIFFTVLNLADNESDRVTLTFDYGDGKGDTKVIAASRIPQDVVFEHTYRIRPKDLGREQFVVRLNISDNRAGIGNHYVHQEHSIKVDDPFHRLTLPPWDVVDYASLAGVLSLPVALFMIQRRRSAREEEEEV